MPKSPSAATWRRAIREALGGDLRNLLDLLLSPSTDGGADFYELPADPQLRTEIVLCLLAGPWSRLSELKEADLQFLRTKTGWGIAKPTVSEREVSSADLQRTFGASPEDIADTADAIGVKPDTLTKALTRHRNKKKG